MNDGIKITKIEQGILIKIFGDLDSYHVLMYKEKITLEMNRNNAKYLLWDLKMVTLLDSAGIGLLLGRYNEIRKVNGKAGFLFLTPYARKIIRLTGLSTIMNEYKNIEEFKRECEVIL